MVSAWINLMLQSAIQKNHSLSKAVTMGHFLKNWRNPAEQKFIDSNQG